MSTLNMGPADVAVLETFVVPNYLRHFGEAALKMMLVGDVAAMAHIGCRSGYPDHLLIRMAPHCSLIGVDSSAAAIELARNKAATLPQAELNYYVVTGYPSGLTAEGFSHALALHPLGSDEDRVELFAEMARVLYTGGQALVSLPLRGSFQELGDLLREYALKHDDGELGKLIESAMTGRPSIESLSDELEAVGFEDIDVSVLASQLTFASGRAFTEDPAVRLLVLPELMASTGLADFGEALNYVRDAIDRYWSESTFTLSINVGCASARKP